MRRGNGIVRVLFGMMLALVLVLGVCGGVGAGETKSTAKVTPKRIDKIERKLFSIESDITEIKTFQINNNGQMWFERTKEQAATAKEWTDTHKTIVDDFYNTLIFISGITAALIALLGLFFGRQQKQIALENQNELRQEVEKITSKYKTTTDKAKIEFEEKRTELNDLVKKCEEMKIVCEANANKTGEVLSEAQKRIKNHDNRQNMDEKTKEAVHDVTSINSESNLTYLIALALEHEIKMEWKKARQVWKIIDQEFTNETDALFKIAYSYSQEFNNCSNTEKKRDLITKAIEWYTKTINKSPRDRYALLNLGSSKAKLAMIDPSNINYTLLDEAEDMCRKAENIKRYFGAYNLACISSIKNELEQSKKWLIKSKKEFKTPLCNYLKSDPDLNNLRNHPDYKDWFQDFVEQVCQEEQEAKAKQAESDEDDTDTEE
ncbi:TPR end-of-group domain-containing protein [Maridesulfovibrio sp.]|uniref:TPR end-of-group domain-containing protein n=1 Tax=Maridesulfovibrio sp. TaxID=2795000 RepID=UPI003BAA2384